MVACMEQMLPANHGHKSTPNPNSTIQGVSVQHTPISDPLNNNGSPLWEKSFNGHPVMLLST